MARKKKWIQGAVKREGAFTAWCKRHGFSGVTKACIEKAKQIAKRTGNRRLMGQANLAYRFKYGDISKTKRGRRRKRKK